MLDVLLLFSRNHLDITDAPIFYTVHCIQVGVVHICKIFHRYDENVLNLKHRKNQRQLYYSKHQPLKVAMMCDTLLGRTSSVPHFCCYISPLHEYHSA